jgi:hypothetical protein
MDYWPIGNALAVGNLCVNAHDSIVFVGTISKDCVCIPPFVTTTATDWTELKVRGQTIKVRSLGGSKFEVLGVEQSGSWDSKKTNDCYCQPIPGVS